MESLDLSGFRPVPIGSPVLEFARIVGCAQQILRPYEWFAVHEHRVRGRTAREVGDETALSDGAMAQHLRRWEGKLVEALSTPATMLSWPLLGPLRRDGLVHRSAYRRVYGDVDPGYAVLMLRLCGMPVRRHEDAFLHTRTWDWYTYRLKNGVPGPPDPGRGKAARARAAEWVEKAIGVRAEGEALDDIVLLARALRDDAWDRHVRRRDAKRLDHTLARVLSRADGPMGVAALAAAIGRPELAARVTESKQWTLLENYLAKTPKVLRYSHGEWVHEDRIPVPAGRLAAAIDWCVARLARQDGGMSHDHLYAELTRSRHGHVMLTPELLRAVLLLHPDVRSKWGQGLVHRSVAT